MPEPAYSQRSFVEKGGEHGQGGSTAAAPSPRTPLDAEPAGVRRSLALRGELDLDSGQWLRADLYRTLSHTSDGLDLDLAEVEFCDCSGLNLLLGLRQHAIEQGKTIVIRSSSPAVERLLDVTGTRHLFMPPGREEDEDAPCPVVHEANPPEGAEQDLHLLVAQLRRAMRTRPTIDLARGILMSSFSLSPEQAWDVLVTVSQNTNIKLYVLAGDVVSTVEGVALPAAVRKQIELAVAKSNAAAAAAADAAAEEPLGVPRPDGAVREAELCHPPDSVP
ncbi:ANTAR domain-containing protein [Streptomyces sp. NPDC029674]|uniref:ANTAR domain-containing protein n=1 Tax=Streptomyces sp. NPDC029674 TaxID=3365297 RepID=UPI0038513F21